MKTKQIPAIAYYRVSTARQGQSGLGLAAQKASVESFCRAHGYRVDAVYQDVESGKHADRPGLTAALADASSRKATLVIAKLDRLSRNVAFIMALRDSGVAFVAVDLPEANTTTIGIMAVLAQAERELISGRTKAALAALKARGKKLGSPHNNLTDSARRKAIEIKKREARAHANGAVVVARNYRAAGFSLQRIADELTKAGTMTRHGHEYTPTTVTRLLKMKGED